ncbi:microcystin degradation protein MlrC [Pandoraea horticolens]|uniref:Microcystinase C n=1 Tax=Pandoraea horticolens TaxID=2508298 RepID=A0A5E4RXJ0_9BURK|nr:M81 family metallopeptidase [Pandoraea horticolens]VVD68250.1 microcystin degradation protein MlrC [Pandoraea horticolens]
MKVMIARMNHETNTFSPVPTPLEAFGNHGPAYDEAAYRDNKGMRTAMAAFIDLAEAAGAEIVTPVSASANPSGPVAAGAYDELCRRIVAAASGVDAILLDLHGAMVAENSDDGEGDLLERLRAVAPATPIAVALDLHSNITPKIVTHADIVVGFKTYPHIDMYETGEHAGRLLFDMLAGKRRPKVVWQQPPLMVHTLRSTSHGGAMKRALDAARRAEAEEGIPAVSVFSGFSLADIPAPCISVVVTADDGEAGVARAQAVADRIAAQIWDERDGFVYRSAPLAESIAQAKQLADGADKPVLLLDHSDNCMSGGTCDTMDVLEAALAGGLTGIGVGPLCDPEAVATLIAAGEGAEVTLAVGNKRPLSQLGITKTPPVLTGIVRKIGDGEYVVTGPTYTGQRCYMGRTVLFDIGAARIVVTERTHEAWDHGVFTCVGLDPRNERFLLLKSRMYCRPVFVPISAGLVECDSDGVTSSNYALFPFSHLNRPVYPLDREVKFGG